MVKKILSKNLLIYYNHRDIGHNRRLSFAIQAFMIITVQHEKAIDKISIIKFCIVLHL